MDKRKKEGTERNNTNMKSTVLDKFAADAINAPERVTGGHGGNRNDTRNNTRNTRNASRNNTRSRSRGR